MRALGIRSWQGWRKTGAINVILSVLCEVILLLCFAVSLSQRDTASIGSTQIFEGSCESASTVDTILHLSLNIASTGILASSNFFMQIVTSPSRKEIDQAHIFLQSLKIGLQSPSNIPALSRTKQICWAILLISSIPIHIFFNSSIYSTAYQGTRWNVTIATSYFAQNGIENQTYWLPGASLAVSGSSSPVQTFEYDRAILNSTGENVWGFGDAILGGYWNDRNSDVRQEIATTAQHCVDWTQLDPEACMNEFRPYKLHTKFKNVVMIVDPGEPQGHGWRREQVFDFESENLRYYWDSKVPPAEVNSLWFWAPCTILPNPRYVNSADWVDGSVSRRDSFKEELKAYDHSCGRLFGLNTSQPTYHAKVHGIVPVSFTNDGLGRNTTKEEISKGYEGHPGARTLQIDHCLAQPVTCQVRVSNTLILIVMVCVLVKITTCIFLLLGLKDASLVTPGDAIESFISKPDPMTNGLGTLTLSAALDLECQPRKIYSTVETPELTFAIRPRRWTTKPHRLSSSVSRGTWIQVYYPIFLAWTAIAIAIVFASRKSGLKTFGRSEDYSIWSFGEGFGYLGTLIIVNTPQVILSCLYLAVNTLHTQLQVEHEFNSYGRQYSPLRVSHPVGKQVSTYRLQLPYKYSIPLISASILLHWLVSSSIFLLVVEGGPEIGTAGRWWESRPDLAADMGVSPDAVIAVGYSGLSALIFFCTSVVVGLSPFYFRYRTLHNDMVVGGTNSLVLSAACHVAHAPRVSETQEYNSQLHIPSAQATDEEDDYLQEVARGNVRWGAMPLPPDTAKHIEVDNNESVMHLGFGTEDHDVQAPQTGMLYA